MSQIEEHLTRLKGASEACVAEALSNHRRALGEVHLLDEDIGEWATRIQGPERDQLLSARRELALAEYAIASGLYRQAFSSLRLFLELCFAAVHFSVNELERRQWHSDRIDFSWSGALDEEKGVLSKSFVLEFLPSLAGDSRHYATKAAQCYRHCSQFVHGKAAVTASIPEGIEYRGEVVADWCGSAKQAGESVLFLLLVRYGICLEAATDDRLSEILSSRFGHLPAVRDLLGLAGD